jgi:signal transduction histidine kinase/CheY-like chemotaxis protein
MNTHGHDDETAQLEFKLKNIEKDLNEQKEFYENLLQYSAVATFVIDAEHKVIYWNKACEMLTGISSSDILGTTDHWKAFYEKKRPTVADLIIDGADARMPDYYTTYGRSSLISNGLRAEGWYPNLPAGRRYIIFDAAPIYNENREIKAAVETLQDITTLKYYEEEVLKLQKLESIGLLAGGLAHDFNNLLTAILGNISLAKTYSDPSSSAFEILTEAEKASLRARDLTNQLITFSKGGFPIKRTVSIASLLRDSVLFMLSGSNIKSEFSIADDLCPVEIDEGQISRVIHNIVVNAVQAMPDGGIVFVSACNIVINQESNLPLEDGKHIQISITDSGTGINNEFLSKIFDPYFTTKPKGNGFGLAIAYSIIRRHNGIIRVKSEPGAGTTFYIYLPASEKEIIPEKKMEREKIKDSGKILVMDDEEMVRNIAERILCNCGYKVEFAKNGTEAVELYKKAEESGKCFDVVIMDLTIPGGMGGKKAIKLLKELDPDIKAIVSSGYSNDPIMADFKKYGFRGALIKPYKINELIEAIQKVITENK